MQIRKNLAQNQASENVATIKYGGDLLTRNDTVYWHVFSALRKA